MAHNHDAFYCYEIGRHSYFQNAVKVFLCKSSIVKSIIIVDPGPVLRIQAFEVPPSFRGILLDLRSCLASEKLNKLTECARCW